MIRRVRLFLLRLAGGRPDNGSMPPDEARFARLEARLAALQHRVDAIRHGRRAW